MNQQITRSMHQSHRRQQTSAMGQRLAMLNEGDATLVAMQCAMSKNTAGGFTRRSGVRWELGLASGFV